jgi:hypothetical protein
VLREPKYEDYKGNIKIDAGKTTTVSQTLQARTLAKPPFDRLRVVGFEKFAPVYVNGMFMGHADKFNAPGQRLLLNLGDYELKIASQSGALCWSKK